MLGLDRFANDQRRACDMHHRLKRDHVEYTISYRSDEQGTQNQHSAKLLTSHFSLRARLLSLISLASLVS